MKKLFLFSFIACINILFWIGCRTPTKEDGYLSEGEIIYSAEPLDLDNPLASLAPSKMIVKFKNNNTSAQMSAGMGALTASFISNPKTQTFTQVIRLFSERYFVIQNGAEVKKENDLSNIEIIPTKETKVIAGYICKKARVHYKEGDSEDYDIYYTTELNIKNSNFSTPFYKLDGVLMEYRMKKFGLELQFTATSITKESIENSVFEIPADYEQITQTVLTDKLTAYQ